MRKILVAVIVIFVLSFGCFAASLDDPVPDTKPTIGSEIKRGYKYAQSLAEATPFDKFSFRTFDKETPNLSNKSDAYMAGFWMGAWECNVLDNNAKQSVYYQWREHSSLYSTKFSDCCTTLEIKESEVAKLLKVDLPYLQANWR
ncbi:MAG: hypothetical protein Q8910_00175 [Bacteroidota bacterium]|nr:hypothetical protein [Bacteroidota bacterium]